MSFNFKAFLSSKLAYLKVNTEDGKYAEVLNVNQTFFASQAKDLEDVLLKFDENIKKPNEDAKKTMWKKIKSLFVKEEEEEAPRVNYFIVNLSSKLSPESSPKFLKTIYDAALEDISMMDVPCVRTIIEYKWSAHTFQFFFF